MVYLPFPSNRFGDFYGLGNPDTIFYFAIPYYCITRLSGMNYSRRAIIASSGCLGYLAIKHLTISMLVKRQEFWYLLIKNR